MLQRNRNVPSAGVRSNEVPPNASYGAILIGSWLEGEPEKGPTGSAKNEG
jgi:hypothetical protein